MAWQGAFIAAGSITTYYFYKMKKNILALRTVSVKKKKMAHETANCKRLRLKRKLSRTEDLKALELLYSSA